MTDNDRQKKTIRIEQFTQTLAAIDKTNDKEQMIRQIALMQLRCLDFMAWLDRVDDGRGIA